MGRASSIKFKSLAYIYVGDFFMSKNKKDYLIKTVVFQFITCAIVFSIFISANYFNITKINLFFDNLNNKLNENISKNQVEEAFKEIEKFSKEVFSITNFNDEKINIKILGEGGKDLLINNNLEENISTSKYKFNFNIYKPVIDGEISSEFGTRIHPINNNYSFHKGLDIAVAEGTPIYASFDGEVIESDFDQWNGNYIKIKHDNNIITVYCHCKQLFVKKGVKVRGGEVIASVGSTGQSTGPHLHYEIRVNDISYNPKYALEDAINAV